MRTTILPFLLPIVVLGAEPDYSLVDGVIDGAPYQIAIPAERSGNLLIHAHGYRREGTLHDAILDLEDTGYKELLERGWVVAMSGYRRNGFIVEDAIEDLLSLRALLVTEYGPFKQVLLEGQSMGGLIVTKLAERGSDQFSAALAIGSALRIKEHGRIVELSHKPEIPILFLSNRSEVTGPQTYVKEAAGSHVPPVFWRVDRDGHVNVNKHERLIAIGALVGWFSTGALESERELTVRIAAEDADVELHANHATGSVVDITHNYGNVFIDLNQKHFEALGINTGEDYRVTIGEVSVTVQYGSTFSDVPTGDWISFPTAEGDTIIAVNQGSAFDHLKPEIGDPVRVEAIPGEPEVE